MTSGPRRGPASSLPPITEKAWLRQVTQLAHTFGWATYHTQLSKWSEAGWPDLALVRPPRLVLAELKTDRPSSRTTEAQEQWLDLLGACPGVEVYEWRPSDLDEVKGVLR